MKIKQYQVDAFSAKVFGGNPAAVVPLQAWLPDSLLQAIAEENNLSETAFLVPAGSQYELRWFTPLAEVNLCGHATLATAHVLFAHEGVLSQSVSFLTRSGELVVQRLGSGLEMNFPSREPSPCEPPVQLLKALGEQPTETLAADDYIVVYESEDIVRRITPDMTLLCQLGLRGVAITAPGSGFDFVSRFFAPKLGVPEDPVTGSTHCSLAPYWGKRLNRARLKALQCSRRGGEVGCELVADRVLLSGHAKTFMEAIITVEQDL